MLWTGPVLELKENCLQSKSKDKNAEALTSGSLHNCDGYCLQERLGAPQSQDASQHSTMQPISHYIQTYSSTPQPSRVECLPNIDPRHPKETSKTHGPDNTYIINTGKIENVSNLGVLYWISFWEASFKIPKFLSMGEAETETRSEMKHGSCYFLRNQIA